MGKPRWPFNRSMSTTISPNPPSDPPPEPPSEFLCPISRQLMADPVILPNGQTFERACVQACLHLSLQPPSDPSTLPLSSLTSSTPLIPNLSLRSSILTWSRANSHPAPVPLDLSQALACLSHHPKSAPSILKCTSGPALGRDSGSESDEVSKKIDSDDAKEAVEFIRRETKESTAQRKKLCTLEIVAGLCRCVSGGDPSAAAALVNLSLDPDNKIPIVRFRAVPALVGALSAASPELRSHAAAAVFSLSVEEENKAVIGALGAIPVLIGILYDAGEGVETRRDAALAVHHLITRCAGNVSRVVKVVRKVVEVAEEEGVVGGVAVVVVGNLAGSSEGRAAVMDAGGIEAMVRVVRVAKGRRREQGVGVLYALSQGSLRFKGLAVAAGAEDVLQKVVEEANAGVSENGRVSIGEKARRMLACVRGEVEEEEWDSGSLRKHGRRGSVVIGESSSEV